MFARSITVFYAATLLTLPWAGLGLVHLFSGRDLGAGFQPAYLLLAVTLGLCLLTVRRGDFHQSGSRKIMAAESVPRAWIWAAGAVGVAVLLSGLGIWRTPAAQPLSALWLRYGKQVLQLAIMACFLFFPAVWTRGPQRWNLTLRCLALGALFQVVYGCLQGLDFYYDWPLFAGLEHVFTSNPAILAGSEQLYVGDAFLNVPRLRGTICEPLYLGNYLLFVLPWLIWVAPRRSWWLVTMVGGVLLLFLTWSRGAWLAGAAQLLLVGVMGLWGSVGTWRVERVLGRLLCLAFGLALGVLIIGTWLGWGALALPLQRLVQSFSQQDWSNLTRLFSMQAAWRAFLGSPVWGVGWGQFGFHFPLLVDPMGLQSQFSWPVVNNFPLAILCETGVLGLGVFLTIMIRLANQVRTCLAGLFHGADPDRRRVRAAAVAVAGVWLQMLTFSQYNLPHIWVAVGLLLAALQDVSPESLPGGNQDSLPDAKEAISCPGDR